MKESEKEWNKPKNGIIYVPNEFNDIVSTIRNHVKTVKYSDKKESEITCNIIRECQLFFKDFYNKD